MRIEIVRNKSNLIGGRIHGIGCEFEDICKIDSRSGFSDNGFTVTPKRLENHKDISDTVTFIYRIDFFWLTRSTRNAGFPNELLIRFVNANDWVQWIIRTLVNIQHIFHFCYEFSACFRNAPFFNEPRLDFVFFITSQTVLSVI